MSSPEELFWDDFASEYAAIQEESQLTIAADVVTFLKEIEVLPIDNIVDFAAGSGKYIPAFYPLVQRYLAIDFSQEMLAIISKNVPDPQEKITLVKKNQQTFLNEPYRYTCIFMAMNPALTDQEELLRFCRKTKTLLILRVVQESENLFQPYEKDDGVEQPFDLIHKYKQWLDQSAIGWTSKRFSYNVKEDIEQSMFHDYFIDAYEDAELELITKQLFGTRQLMVSTTHIVFELLVIG